MTIRHVAFNSFTPVSTPTIVNGEFIDGHVDGQPVQLRKMHGGMIMPVIGTTVTLPYGAGHVTGYNGEFLKVAITEFNEDYAFETKDAENPDILDAEEMVESLNRCLVRAAECNRRTFTRLYKSDITDVLSDKNYERMVEAFPMPACNEISVAFSGDYLAPTDTIVVKELPKQSVETKAERRARRALEVAEAERLAKALLDAYDAENGGCPEDIAAEIADEFGDTDFDDTDFNDGEEGGF